MARAIIEQGFSHGKHAGVNKNSRCIKEVRGENNGILIQAQLGEIPEPAETITDIGLVDVISPQGIGSLGNREEESLHCGGLGRGNSGDDPPVVIKVVDHPGIVKSWLVYPKKALRDTLLTRLLGTAFS